MRKLVTLFSIITVLFFVGCEELLETEEEKSTNDETTTNDEINFVSAELAYPTEGVVFISYDSTLLSEKIFNKLEEILTKDYPEIFEVATSNAYFNVSFKEKNTEPVNLIHLTLDETLSKAKLAVSREFSSPSKTKISISGNNENSIIDLITKKADTIITIFEKDEIDRFKKIYSNLNDMEETFIPIKNKQNVEITLPNTFKIIENEYRYMYANWKEGDQTRIGVVIYQIPYSSEKDFTNKKLIEVRDSVLKENKLGPSEESYIKTVINDLSIPTISRMKINNQHIVEMRGMWELKSGSKGGPFISYTTIDKKRNMIVTAEAFLYFPDHSKSKAPYMRKCQAILETFSIN
jgi:hypothetical protein